MTDGVLRRAKRRGRLPRATPVRDPWLPAYPSVGSWQLAQLVPAGSDRPTSKNILRPSSARAARRTALPCPSQAAATLVPELDTAVWTTDSWYGSGLDRSARAVAPPQKQAIAATPRAAARGERFAFGGGTKPCIDVEGRD
jgi:hypothetical protein